jgi:hypothetical protein
MRFILTIATFAVALIRSISPACAEFELRLEEFSGNTLVATTVFSDTIANSASSGGGNISGGSINNSTGLISLTNVDFHHDFQLSSESTSSNSTTGSGTIPAEVDLSQFKITNLTGGALTLVVTASDNGFNFPTQSPGSFLQADFTTLSINNGSSESYTAIADPGDHVFGETSQDTLAGGVTQTSALVQSTAVTAATTTTPFTVPTSTYSLTDRLVLNMGAGATINSQADGMVKLPEPVTTVIWGLGAVGMGLVLARRRGKACLGV